jgi:hypothetical protein
MSGTTTIKLNGAGVGDRFCLYDIGPNIGDRRQYGCEVVENSDNVLTLEKDVTWAPMIEISLETSRTVAVSVTQLVSPGQQIQATLYPEDKNAATAIDLVSQGDLHTGVFHSSIPALAAYVVVNVDETATEEDPRREALIEYGTGGSGAYGPASRLAGVPIISGDGQAEYAPGATTTLEDGEFISWQSMAGSPATSAQRQILGYSYKLLALPPSLAQQGTVSIRVPDTPTPLGRIASNQTPVLHFWTGTEWIPLASTVVADPQGGGKVIAPSQGVGIYALLQDKVDSNSGKIYLPIMQK